MGKFYIGQFNNNLDEQRRILVPSKFNLAEEKLILVKGFEECINLYTVEAFNEIIDKVKELSFTKANNREFLRMFLSGAFDCNVDAKGRISIPEELALHASLEKECVFVGTGTYIEIWSKAKWNEYYNNHSDSLSKIAEEVSL